MSKIRAKHAGIFALMLVTMIAAVLVTPAYIILSVAMFIPAQIVRLLLWIADGRHASLDGFRVSSIYQSLLDMFSGMEKRNAEATPGCTECRFYSERPVEGYLSGRLCECLKGGTARRAPEDDPTERVQCFTYKNNGK